MSYLSQPVAGQPKADAGRRPALAGIQPNGLGVHALGPHVVLFQIVDGRQTQQGRQDVPTGLECRVEEEAGLFQPIGREIPHPPAHQGHGIKIVDLGGLGEPVVRLGDEILPQILFLLADLLGDRQMGDSGRRKDPDPVVLSTHIRPFAAGLQDLGGVLRVFFVLDVVQGGVGPDAEIGVLVGHDLEKIRALGFGDFLWENFDKVSFAIGIHLAVAPDWDDEGWVILVFDDSRRVCCVISLAVGWR